MTRHHRRDKVSNAIRDAAKKAVNRRSTSNKKSSPPLSKTSFDDRSDGHDSSESNSTNESLVQNRSNNDNNEVQIKEIPAASQADVNLALCSHALSTTHPMRAGIPDASLQRITGFEQTQLIINKTLSISSSSQINERLTAIEQSKISMTERTKQQLGGMAFKMSFESKENDEQVSSPLIQADSSSSDIFLKDIDNTLGPLQPDDLIIQHSEHENNGGGNTSPTEFSN